MNRKMYMQDPAAKKGAGIVIRTLRRGNEKCPHPNHGDTIKIHYEAYLSTNLEKPFDSTRKRKQPFCFVLGKGQVVHGMEVALANMRLYQIAEVFIPSGYAYGITGYPPVIPPRSTLMFRIEFLGFSGPPRPK